MLMLSLVFSVIFGMLSATSVSYSMLAITRTLTGMALSGLSLIVLPLGKCGRFGGLQGLVQHAGTISASADKRTTLLGRSKHYNLVQLML